MKKTIRISTTVSTEFYDLAKKLDINWAEGLRVGLAFLFMERGVFDFINPLHRQRIKLLAMRYGIIKNGAE